MGMHAMTERLLEAESRGMCGRAGGHLAELKELYLETEGGIENACRREGGLGYAFLQLAQRRCGHRYDIT
jgi:cobalamin biosynthesis Mg chelatase CobN